MTKIKKFVLKFLNKLNLHLLYYTNYLELIRLSRDGKLLRFATSTKKEEGGELISNDKKILSTIKYGLQSKSQAFQEIFVLNKLDFKTNGFFVEFGAMDGIHASNTYLLEKEFNWHGILSEPNKTYKQKLSNNRNCYIDTNLVWKNSNSELLFSVTSRPATSTIHKYINNDHHDRKPVDQYYIKTISLTDLLLKYNAPQVVDYLSIDTEGSEFDILNNLNFEKFKFRIITCEHNFNKNREQIEILLNKNGYKKVISELTKGQIEDWYINSNLFNL